MKLFDVELETEVRRDCKGRYDVGIRLGGASGSWSWVVIKARNKRDADKQAPAAIAVLLNTVAKNMEAAAAKYAERAVATRLEAKRQASLADGGT